MEQADIEFVKLKSTISKYEESLTNDIKAKPSQIEINKASLISFMSNNDNVIKFEDNLFVKEYGLIIKEIDAETFAHDKLIERIKNLGIENIKQLEEFFLKNEESIKESLKSIFPHTSTIIKRGASILILINYTFSNHKN